MRVVPKVLAVLLIPLTASLGQVAGGVSLGSGVGQIGGSAWTRESRFSPALRYSSPFASLLVDGTVAERGGAIAVDRAAVASVLAAPAFGPVRLAADAAYRRDADVSTVASIAPSLSVKRGNVGAWFGSVHAQRAEARLQAGLWASFRSAVFSLSSQTRSSLSQSIRAGTVFDSTFNDTLGRWEKHSRTQTDTTHSRSAFRWSQLEARVEWSHRRLALSGSLTTSHARDDFPDSSTANRLTWGRVNAAFVLNDRLSLIAGVGTLPGSPVRQARPSRFATFGIRFSPAMLLRDPVPAAVRPSAYALSVEPVEPGVYKLVLRAPSARTIELSGDFNRWTPLAMTQTGPDVWEATLALSAGTHRLNMRIDGDRWTAPPGLAAVDDEFNGRVGILVVR